MQFVVRYVLITCVCKSVLRCCPLSASDDKFVMRADSTKVVFPGDRGRDSVRITSHKAYDDSIMVLDLSHMPEGCSTWPAFWTISQSGPWPNGGEIDILEGTSERASLEGS